MADCLKGDILWYNIIVEINNPPVGGKQNYERIRN